MNKFRKFILLIIMVCVSIYFLKRMYISKVRETYISEITKVVSTDQHIVINNIEKYEDKTNNIKYKLDLGYINGFEIYAQILNTDNLLEPNENTKIKINIENFEIANLLHNKYGDKYKVTEITECGYIGEEEFVSRCNGAYKFKLENRETRNIVTGYIPSSKNLDEMFEVNERKDLDFEF